MMRFHEKCSGVFVVDEDVVRVSIEEINFLKERLKSTPRGRVRLCAHRSGEDLLHEMLIALTQKTYVRPHRHFGKCESFHIIEGSADVVVFDDAGEIKDTIYMGEPASGKTFFYRLSTPLFHTLLIRSELLIIHETTTGPFRSCDVEFAPWAPEETDADATRVYTAGLANSIRKTFAR